MARAKAETKKATSALKALPSAENSQDEILGFFEKHGTMHPAEFLTLIMRGDAEAGSLLKLETTQITFAMRRNAAMELLPYVAAKQKAVELSTGDNKPVVFAIMAPPGAADHPPDLTKGAAKAAKARDKKPKQFIKKGKK